MLFHFSYCENVSCCTEIPPLSMAAVFFNALSPTFVIVIMLELYVTAINVTWVYFYGCSMTVCLHFLSHFNLKVTPNTTNESTVLASVFFFCCITWNQKKKKIINLVCLSARRHFAATSELVQSSSSSCK